MILDKLAELSVSQVFGATGNSDFSYDCGNPTVKNRIGTGEDLSVVFVVKAATVFAGAGPDLLVIQSDNADLTSQQEIINRRFPGQGGSFVGGAIFDVPIPAGTPTKRYLGARIEHAGGGASITASAYLVPREHVQAWIAYAKGYSI